MLPTALDKGTYQRTVGMVVRRYLQLSMADMQEDLSASSAPVSGDMGDRCASHDHVGGEEGVVMCLAMCHSLIHFRQQQ